MMLTPISVVIVARDAAKTIESCLASLNGFDEVVVLIDDLTSDNTAEICSRFSNTQIAYTSFEGFGKIKQKAVTLAKNEWVLSVDADEVLSQALIEFLKTFQPHSKCVYAIQRYNHYKGRHINACGWNNDFPIRLFNKKFTNFNDANIHEAVVTDNFVVEKINPPILHYPYENEAQLEAKAERYAQLYAKQNHRKKNISLWSVPLRSAFTFFKDYVLRRGWLYDSDGFTIARYNALGTKLKYRYLHQENKDLGICLIISTYNRADALDRVLQSVLQQTRLPHQIIIADDGSTEDTALLIQQYKQKLPNLLHVWHKDTGFRLAAIRNLALKSVNQPFVSMVDGDMVLHPDFINSIYRHAQKGWYYQGKRVLLDEKNTKTVLNNQDYKIRFFTPGIRNRFNTLNLPYLSSIISRKENSIRGVKGCSMHFWTEDVIKVNGFNESFIGWGREDSEFVCRLLNAGIQRKNIALSAVAWHLYHPEASRKMLPENDAILEKCILEKHNFTPTGLNS